MAQKSVWSFVYGPLVEFDNPPDGFSSTNKEELPDDEKKWFDLEMQESDGLHDILAILTAAIIDVSRDSIESYYTWSWVDGRARPTANLKVIASDKNLTPQEIQAICSITALQDGRAWIRCLQLQVDD